MKTATVSPDAAAKLLVNFDFDRLERSIVRIKGANEELGEKIKQLDAERNLLAQSQQVVASALDAVDAALRALGRKAP